MTRSHSFVGIGFVTLALLCAAGCAGSDPGDTDAGNNDAGNNDGGNNDAGPGSAPSVSSTTPVAGAAGVSLTSAFAVIFSEAMDPATLTTSTFTVTAANGSAVSGAVTYSGVTAVFRPSAALAASTTYTATLSTGAKSQGDVALPASYSWTITTSAAADTTAPTIDSTSPASAATGVSLNAGISVTFSEAMDPSTITAATFTLKLGTTAVAGAVDSVGATATFIPSAALAANSTYTATIVSAKDLSGNALAGSESFVFTTGASAAAAPTILSTSPANLATGVAINSAVLVSFSEAMSPASVSAATFKVTSAGNVAVAGSVTYSGTTATFQPASHLANSTQYTATVTTGVKDLGGTALAAAQVWTFTTGAAADTTPPTVTSTNPLTSATAVLTTAMIKAVFSEAITPQTVSGVTFTVTGPGSARIAGSVTFDSATRTASFLATTSLAVNTTYSATIHGGANGVKDLAGNPLASDYVWSFTTGGHAGLSPVLLGSSANYVILAKTAISTVPTSAVTGDVALSPAAASFITGFALTLATGFATSTQVTGKLYAADFAAPTPSLLTTAITDMQTGYTDAAGRPTPDFLNLSAGAIGGLTLTPGLYKWTSTVTIPDNVTISGNQNDVWIFQVSGDLTMSAAKHITLSGGALAKNIFWQVAGTVNFGANSHFEGIILSQTAITLQTMSSMNGRALAQTAVALQQATVTKPAP
jgi:hypothetical protein